MLFPKLFSSIKYTLIAALVLSCSIMAFQYQQGTITTSQNTIDGSVIYVIDGDTVKIRNEAGTFTIRLAGIDAPEKQQSFGLKAKHHLNKLVTGKEISANIISQDKYGRLVAFVFCEKLNINAQMLSDGYAWHYSQYDADPELIKLMHDAQADKRGLWSDNTPTAPWVYRKANHK